MQLKKYRKQEQCFVVEGGKSVLELAKSDFKVIELLGTPEFLSRHRLELSAIKTDLIEVSPMELAAAGEYGSNDAAMAIVYMRPMSEPVIGIDQFVLMLDDLRDPGNLGTIIRTADWYGINTIIASRETADVYNSKVIQSSMGSFTRVNVHYMDLPLYLSKNGLPVFGALLKGESVHTVDFGRGGIIVIGNEASGISNEVERYVTHRITIPRFGHAESLNAAIATSIICDNIRRSDR